MRLAMRRLLRQPAFAITAIGILALGIGATTAMFSVTNTLTLAPLPYPEPERLARLYRTVENDRGFPNPHSAAAYQDYRRLATAFEGLAAYAWSPVDLAVRPEHGQPARALTVTSSFFSVHGMAPLLGRTFHPDDDKPGAPPTVVLSWSLWQNLFAGDPGVVGRRVRLGREGHTVIGVMPRAFNDLRRAWARVDLWHPLVMQTSRPTDRQSHRFQIVGRLKQGHSIDSAQAEMDRLTSQLNREHGTRGGVFVLPLGDTGVNHAETRATQLTLSLAVTVLLIACFNLAGLQFGRLAGRRHEHTVRLALGASRGDLIRESLAESFLLCLLGGLLGLLVADQLTQAISSRLVLFGSPAGITIGLDPAALAFAAAAVVTTTLAVSLLPAWLNSRSALADPLRAAGRGTTRPGQPRLRYGLVMAQMALALVLLGAGGLFVRGLDRFVNEGPGWKPDGLVSGSLGVPREDRGDPARQSAFFERLLTSVASLPSVERVSLSDGLPMSIFAANQPFLVEGRPPPAAGQAPIRYLSRVSGQHFATVGMKLVRGRTFAAGDGPDAQPVVIINEAMARALWPDGDPIGKRIGAAVGEPRWSTVVGVVTDAGVAAELRAPITRFRTYGHIGQEPQPWVTLTARTRASAAVTTAELRQAIARLDPTQRPFEARPVRDTVDLFLANLSLLASLLFGFALLGMALAALGVYALFGSFVTQRTREIGVRIALGARSEQVLWLVLRKGLRLALAGAVVGFIGSLIALRILTATASELPPHELRTLFALPLTLIAVALFASWLPARRAAKLDPMVALRQE